MTKKDKFFDKAFSTLNQEGIPTEQQKDVMLHHILTEYRPENSPSISKWKSMIIVYPWRFAFLVSAFQAVILTVIFGRGYTNLFLSVFGG